MTALSHSAGPGSRSRTPICVIGTADGMADLLADLRHHDDIEVLQTSTFLDDAAGTLEGGGVEAVLYVTHAGPGWLDDLAAIREHTSAPIVLLSSNQSGAVLEQAFEAGVAEAFLLPQAVETVAFALRRAHRTGGGLDRRGRAGRGQRHDRVLAEGRDREDGGRDQPGLRPGGRAREANPAARPRPSVRRHGDRARAPSGADAARPDLRSGRTRLGEARGILDAARVRPGRPAGAASPAGRRPDRRREAGPPLRGRPRDLRRDRGGHRSLPARGDPDRARLLERARPDSAAQRCRR